MKDIFCLVVDKTVTKVSGATVFTPGCYSWILANALTPGINSTHPVHHALWKLLLSQIAIGQLISTWALSDVAHTDALWAPRNCGSRRWHSSLWVHPKWKRLQTTPRLRASLEGETDNKWEMWGYSEPCRIPRAVISVQVLAPDQAKLIDADMTWLLVVLSYEVKFLPHIAELTQQLTDLLKMYNEWTWRIMQQQVLEALHREQSSSTVLVQCCQNREMRVAADASTFGLRGVLSEKQPSGDWRFATHIPWSMTEAECRYAPIEMKHGHWCGHVSVFSLIWSDWIPPYKQNRNLCSLVRLQLLCFTYSIMDIPGKSLVTADSPSRTAIQASSTAEDMQWEEDVRAYFN